MQKHTFSNGFTTDFEYIQADFSNNTEITLVYTHGFCADPWGRKPDEIKEWCAKHNISFYRYELAGHGSDAANIEKADFNIDAAAGPVRLRTEDVPCCSRCPRRP